MSTSPRALALLALLLTACPPAGKDESADDTGDTDTDTPADPCPVAVLDPETITWSELVAGEAATAEISVLNNCTGATNLTLELSTTDAAFIVSPGLGGVAPGEVGTFTVTVTATTQPGATGTVQIVTNDPASPLLSVALTAELAADQDGDGVDYRDDCDDTDASVYPSAPDALYDGVDSDCIGNSDYDADGDGFDSDGYGGNDCDDADATVNPAATETYYDGVDQNCDGLSDDDADGDGADIGADCDDTDAAAFPGNAESWYDGIDGDCDGTSDYDQDGDGSDAEAYGGTDCDDTEASTYYGAPDAWYDGVDADCAGNDDDDADYDGYAATSGGGDDCDDTTATVSPAATEVWYDGVDSDCDGASDYDQDGDGVAAYTSGGADCADTDASTLAGPAETRNGLDDDCDGYVDDGLAAPGDVVITEIMTNPAAVSDTYGEWFELYNDSGYELDLYGWVIYSDDGGSITIATSLPVAAGAYVVLGAEDDTALNGGVAVDYQYTRSSFALSDTEGIYVMSGSTTVTGFEFDSSWPVSEGASLSLDPTSYDDPTDDANWCAATSTLSGGDAGTPGAVNDGCPQIDGDGDGYSDDDGDCDDQDAGIGPGVTEVEDGVDQDCNGAPDDIVVSLTGSPSVVGTSSSDQTVRTAADFDGDGAMEVLFPSYNWSTYRYTGLYVLDGASYASWAGGAPSTYDVALISGTSLSTSTDLGDNDGDGLDELVTLSVGTTTAWQLFDNPAGSVSTSSASITCVSMAANDGGVTASADLSGDGIPEVVFTDYYSSAYGTTYGGMVAVYDVVGVSGTIAESSADLIIRGTSRAQYVGLYGLPEPGDINGDGYVDLLIPEYDSYGAQVVLGDGLATTGVQNLTSMADFAFERANYESVVRDVDGDGAADVLLYGGGVFTNLAGAAGTLGSSDATTTPDMYTSALYCLLTAAEADLDADGVSDAVFSCYDGDRSVSTTMFFGTDAWADATLTAEDSFFSYVWSGSTSTDVVGMWDLDGDGDEELLVTDNTSAYASAYVYEP